MTTATHSSAPLRATPPVTGISHIGLTVRDVIASEAWYGEVLGLVRAFVEPHATGKGYAVVMTRPGTGLLLGLDHHPDAEGGRFSPLHAGLDHVALQVAAREDLDEWVTHLDAIGVEHGELWETAAPVPHAIVLLRDPDDIPIELFWFGG